MISLRSAGTENPRKTPSRQGIFPKRGVYPVGRDRGLRSGIPSRISRLFPGARPRILLWLRPRSPRPGRRCSDRTLFPPPIQPCLHAGRTGSDRKPSLTRGSTKAITNSPRRHGGTEVTEGFVFFVPVRKSPWTPRLRGEKRRAGSDRIVPDHGSSGFRPFVAWCSHGGGNAK